MNKIALVIVLLTTSLFSLKAQDTLEKQRKWLVGVSLTPIFQGNPVAGIPTIGTQIKYALGSGKHVVRLYTSYTHRSSEKDTSFIDNATGFVFAPGYQYTIDEGNFKFFFGGDLYIESLSTINKTGTTYSKVETGRTGIKLFMGASYHFNKRLSISAELGKLVANETKNIYASEKGTATTFQGAYNNFFGGQALMLNYHF